MTTTDDSYDPWNFSDDDPWPEIDPDFLHKKRTPVRPFPLDVLPAGWRAWIADRARGLSAPVDYAALGVLGLVSGACGCGVEIRVTPEWSEPLVLWQALVGAGSSGKSAVLERLREVLGTVEASVRRSHGQSDDGPSCIAVDTPALGDIAPVVAANPRGVLLWRDHPSAWLGTLAQDRDACAAWRGAWSARPFAMARARDGALPLRLNRLAVGILGTLEPEQLAELEAADGGLVSRFLYAWPDAAPFCRFAERRQSKADEASRLLQRIEEQARQSAGPLALSFESSALGSLETFLARLHRETGEAEGLDAAWLGKGPANVVRLAAALHLLAWSEGDATRPPGPIDRATVEAAVTLWNDYFRPHALAVINRLGPTELERQSRRVVRWLKASRRRQASRREVRCSALGRTVNAEQTGEVLGRLQGAGIVRPLVAAPSGSGRRPEHWEVNPALLPE
ncbi:MAG: DUF3987 domain-containing protein [Alphaproteobacteria bacterium]|nr:DUF3987 domain-containing protein [Alphaproteobacteria bacterium]MBV8407032.1 DUF3987 domain-containing protein [Alphaproteobacteria bacterium]